MALESITTRTVVDIFLLLLIGVGPKLALVPFLKVTAGMPQATKRLVFKKMLITASTVAAVLLVLGGALTRLLHFSTGALSVASGLILFFISIRMVLGQDDPGTSQLSLEGRDPMQLAVVPLGVPYLLNPVGIVVMVTASAEAAALGVVGVVVGSLIVVLLIDVLVFSWATRVSELLVENRMLVTEMVFGFLLAALAVQLALSGLADLGVIHMTDH
jgi:multiple antibiotic resistance protein